MDNEKIKVICKEPGMPLEIKEVENNYETYHNYVQGTVDSVDFPNREDISIICNDEFLYNGMEPNMLIPERKEVFCGPLMFVGFDDESGQNISLNDEQIKTVSDYIKNHELDESIKVYGWGKSPKKEMEM